MKIGKKLLCSFLALIMVLSMVPLSAFAAQPETGTPDGYLGVSVGSQVPGSFQNDLWTQYDFKELQVGNTATITPRRVPEGVVDTTGNDLQHPHYNYEIISGDSVVLEGSDNLHQGVKAVKAGNTVVKVTYDRFTHTNRNTVFAACDPINTQYVVYSVGGNPAITIEDNICAESVDKATAGKVLFRSYDTMYFTEGESVSFPLIIKTTGAEKLTVKVNGLEVAAASEGVYNLPLENRNNIIEMTATAADGTTRSFFRVLAARKIVINVKNTTRPGQPLIPGETANVSFRGIKMPVYKLASIYNPQFGGNAANVHYTLDGQVYRGKCSQWDLATKNAFNVKLNKVGDNVLTAGAIQCFWWGSPLGTDKGQDSPGAPNLNAPTLGGEFSFLPDFTIHVEEPVPATGVTLSQTTLDLKLNDTATLTAAVAPDNSTARIQWTTDNAQVATVRNGQITAVGGGTAVITVSVIGQPEVKATCTVNVAVASAEVQAVIDRIAKLPHPELIYVEDARDLKKEIKAIDAAYAALGAGQADVTNYDYRTQVLDQCNALIAATPRRMVTDDGHVLTLGKNEGIVKWSYTRHRTLVPEGTKTVYFQQFADKITPINYLILKASNKFTQNSINKEPQARNYAAQLSQYGKLPGSYPWGVIGFNYDNSYFVVDDKGLFEQQDAEMAKKLDEMFCALRVISVRDELSVLKARAEYEHTPKSAQAKVTELAKLEQAEAILEELKNPSAWGPVIRQIDALGQPELTQDYMNKLQAARKAYDALTPEEQAKVTNYQKLVDAEKQYQDLVDAAAAKAVEAKIAALGEITLESEAAVKAAREAYNGLTEAQKALVKNLAVLEAAEAKLAELQKPALFKIFATSMNLEDDLSLNFYMNKTDLPNTEGVYAVITRSFAEGSNKEDVQLKVPFTGWREKTNHYVVSYPGLAAKEMNDRVKVQIFAADGSALSEVYTDSIHDYAVRMLSKSADKPALQTVYVDMLNYGAAAQQQFKYDAAHPANDGIDAYQHLATQEAAVENRRVPGEKYYASTVSLEGKLDLTAYFKVPYSQSCYAVVRYQHYNDQQPTEYRIEGTGLLSKSNGALTGVRVKGLVIADLDVPVEVKLYNAEGELIGQATDSIGGYAARMMEKDPQNPIYPSIAKFGISARQYFSAR